MADLTDEQAAIYDRQLRVWGAGVQLRLMQARVLSIGCTGLAAEVAKNIVLAGVGHLTLLDDTPGAAVPPTFLHPSAETEDGAGEATIADIFASGLQEMNPMVKVEVQRGSTTSLPPDDVIRGHDLVLVFGLDTVRQLALNRKCREHGVAFMAARSRPLAALCFSDLLSHTCRLDADDAASQRSLRYVPLDHAAKVPWNELPRGDQRQVNRLLGAWAVLTGAEIEASRAMGDEDVAALCEAGEARLKASGCRAAFWNEAALRELVGGEGELAPVNAVLGGFIGNDVVRCLSRVGLPSHNICFFSLADGVVQVHNVTGRDEAGG